MRGKEKGGERERRARVGGGERVVSVVRHERKLERGSPLWRPGNRKRPNARHEAPARPKKSSSQQPERKSGEDITLKRPAHRARSQRERAIWSRGRDAKREKRRKKKKKKEEEKKKGFYDLAASVERAADQRALYIN